MARKPGNKQKEMQQDAQGKANRVKENKRKDDGWSYEI